MWGYFVRGAPSMLLRNVQPTKNLANGSMGWQDSLTFDPEPPPEILAAVQAEHFQVVTLDEPPFSINIVPQLPDDDTGDGIQSLTGDSLVVPVTVSSELQEYDTGSLYATMANAPRLLRYHGHPLTLAFAMTDFKVQGRTLPFVILSIAGRPFPPHLDMKGFYVMISRVRQGHTWRKLS